jgi:hypothetical protein
VGCFFSGMAKTQKNIFGYLCFDILFSDFLAKYIDLKKYIEKTPVRFFDVLLRDYK